MEENKIDINFDSLLKQGFGVIDVRFRNYEISDQPFKYVIVQFEGDRDEFYPTMLKHYVGQDIKDKDVFEIWISILSHKLGMSKMLNRDVSIKVAALDFAETKEFKKFLSE